MKKLNKSFFERDSEIVAKALIGKVIKVWSKSWIIYETEAYKWDCDPASHAFWKKTPRNTLMYETFGFVYVYLIYGMYYCLNFTSDKNKPWAVLIRWVKDLETWKVYDGPWKLTKFFGIDKSFNWLDLEKNLKIEVWDYDINIKNIVETTRIGIKQATDKKWRFVGDIIV